MPNTNHRILCPYFVHEKNRSISCEDTARTFTGLAEKEAWMHSYCDDDWQSCPYAKDLIDMYERIERGACMEKEMLDHTKKVTKKEHKTLAMRFDAAEKRAARRQKKIDELKGVNQSLTTKNISLTQRNLELHKKWREADEELNNYRNKISDQIQGIVHAYETRLAYMMDTYSGGELDDEDVNKWGEGKSFAISYEKRSDPSGRPYWKVVFEDNEDECKPVQRAAKDEGAEAEE